MSDVINTKVQEWRRRSALPAGHPESLTIEDMKEAIAAIRKERVQAQETSTKSKARKSAAAEKAKPIDSESLLGELGL